MSTTADQKRLAAEAAAGLVRDGQLVGLGTGSTAEFAIDALIRRVRAGLSITCVPTSERSARQARVGGLTVLDEPPHDRIIDITIDGADQIERTSLHLVKGLGGALLREKIVAAASTCLVIIADETKLVDCLGGTVPVPVEIVSFGWRSTAARLARLGCLPALRRGPDAAPFVTDGGNLILDCRFDAIADPVRLEDALSGIVGVVETGLFIGMATKALVGAAGGVREFTRPGR
ncbi:MAG: ribose 5-phosphate isomerase A [Acetobacteraceae bacterium]